jgi:hypothetical protein
MCNSPSGSPLLNPAVLDYARAVALSAPLPTPQQVDVLARLFIGHAALVADPELLAA